MKRVQVLVSKWTCYGWSSRIPHLSPVGKFWDRISSKSISSEKQRSMNPELTCFPIEEDPSTSGENENRGEVAGTNQTSQEDISSKLMICGAKREHLAELTDACVDPTTSVSAVERFPNRSSFDSVNTDISFNGTCSMVKEKHGNLSTKKRRCTNGAKGNYTSSISTNCVWPAGLACWFSSSVNFISICADSAPDPATVLGNIDADFAVLSELLLFRRFCGLSWLWGKFIMLDAVAAILRKILVVYYCCCCNLRIVLAIYCAVAAAI
ncbi:hypothetical protein U1Q18_033204 [Sarracenia purpurea var. burkii]